MNRLTWLFAAALLVGCKIPCDDEDMDGVCDVDDVCPEGDDLVDLDGDGQPDACDICPADALDDVDGDDVCDSDDICDGNDGSGDSDEDGICDDIDICEGNDATGDADGDGFCDDIDICLEGDDGVDTDMDSVPDACDICDGDDATGDIDEDGLCSDMDEDDDNDGALDADDAEPLNALACSDVDADGCDDCSTGTFDVANDGDDFDADGICNVSDDDDDNDGSLDADDSDDSNPFICSDTDADSCDDCTGGSYDPSSDGLDFDLDGLCNAGDDDDDADGSLDTDDSNPLNPLLCSDTDMDTCDDCASGMYNTAADGPDFDMDGICDAGDDDDDNDGSLDADDSYDFDAFSCSDVDADSCDDCSSGTFDVANDGDDFDADGACDPGDEDDDNDGALDEDDSDDFNANVCSDIDADTCDDCSNGMFDLLDDGDDFDGDGACDDGDEDDDNDGSPDEDDSDDNDPTVCSDDDDDECDDCSLGSYDVANDGDDYDMDGDCDDGDDDDDNDGALDDADSDDFNANVCSDTDMDTCDDCALGSYAPNNDGADFDADGACDAGDTDDDNDGSLDAGDSDDFNANVCSDTDGDFCDDCVNGSYDPSADGDDFDADGFCDAGDDDIDGDGSPGVDDSDDFDPFVCSDTDADGCEDCLNGSYDPANDGIDVDLDGICDSVEIVSFDSSSYTADIVFSEASLLSGTRMTMAWDGTEYWASSGGGSGGNRLASYDPIGASWTYYLPGLDLRSVFTMGDGTADVFTRSYNDRDVDIQTTPGTFVFDTNLVGGILDNQSAVVWDDINEEFVAHESGTVSRWDAGGTYLGAVTLIGYGSGTGETSYPNNRGLAFGLGVYLTYSSGVVSAWDTSTGDRLDSATLTGAGTTFDSHFSYSYANGRFFVVDQSGGSWRGYPIGGTP